MSLADTDPALKIYKGPNRHGNVQDRVERIAGNSSTYFILFIITTLDSGYSQKIMKVVLVFFFTSLYQYSYKAVTVLAQNKKCML